MCYPLKNFHERNTDSNFAISIEEFIKEANWFYCTLYISQFFENKVLDEKRKIVVVYIENIKFYCIIIRKHADVYIRTFSNFKANLKQLIQKKSNKMILNI